MDVQSMHGETARPIGAVAEVSLDVFVPQSQKACELCPEPELTVLDLSKIGMKQDQH